jgi:hypothetical protein
MEKWALGVFIALGGVSLLWKLGKKYIPQAIDAGVEWLLKLPRFHQFVKDNSDDILEILVKAGHLVKEDIEQVKSEPSPESFSTNP